MRRTVSNFTMQPQLYSNLCWAAVALSVDRWAAQQGHWTTLCQAVREGSSPPHTHNCCAALHVCNKIGLVGKALKRHCRINTEVPVSTSSASSIDTAWRTIRDEINKGQPHVVGASVRWIDRFGRDAGKHEIAIVGYSVVGQGSSEVRDTRQVIVADPRSSGAGGTYQFEEFLLNYPSSVSSTRGRCITLTLMKKEGVCQ